MARHERNNVDYFPFLCEEWKKMFYLEQKYWNDWFAVFVKLLRELAKTDFHYLYLWDITTRLFIIARMNVTEELFEHIINDLVLLGKIDKELWEECSVIWCQSFIDSIQDAYLKRKWDCIDRKWLLLLLSDRCIRKWDKSSNKWDKSSQSTTESTQRKEEDIKEEKKKRKKDFIPPSLNDVITYFKEKWYKEDVAKKAFDWYDVADRHDSYWKKIYNWKQKMINVWFKPENELAKPKWIKVTESIEDLSNLAY